ncbi:MAG TPA: zf-HC2 domain-containing protein [Candidatus Dormibacteraeota bacterium]|nr:zf-HC2 domain-containing protein [Candidatus Dormibacteraeota bacterium]
MTCREVVALMTDYLEGALPAADRARFEEHIAGCAGCTAYLEQLRVSLRVLGALAAVPVPEAQRLELVAAFREWRTRA